MSDVASAKDTAIQDFLEKRAIEELPSLPGDPGFYSHIFLVPKKDGQWRPIINLRPLNQFLPRIRFRMLTVKELCLTLQPGQWATSIDLKDAYLHVPIHPLSRRFLRFVHRGRVFQFRALPFGLADVPYVFTRVISAVISAAQSWDIQVSPYLDDWLN